MSNDLPEYNASIGQRVCPFCLEDCGGWCEAGDDRYLCKHCGDECEGLCDGAVNEWQDKQKNKCNTTSS